mgnify:CR=1 FL=1
MSNLLLIFVCLALGIAARRLGLMPPGGALPLNRFIVCVSLPALILSEVPPLLLRTQLTWSMLIPVSMAWIHFLLVWPFVGWVGQRWRWPRTTVGALILTAGLGNTSFVGLPLLEALLGGSAIGWGVIVDQLGSFLVLSTLGIVVAMKFGAGPQQGPSTWRRILRFPPFVAISTALLLSLSGLAPGEWSGPVLHRLAQTLVPLALFAVGLNLKLSLKTILEKREPLLLGITLQLFLAPLFFLLLFHYVLGSDDLSTRVTILEAGMATMINSAILASDCGLDEELANLMVGISVPLSLLTVPLWAAMLPF